MAKNREASFLSMVASILPVEAIRYQTKQLLAR